ncbi:MAG: hypothetical protein KJO91_09615 [Gammaproteobacteria bacterium]|nr:hypothetical protein [Gammaproteobacteria bacterium]
MNRTLKTQDIEDIERAAWYARLAFGTYQEKVAKPAKTPEKPEPTFFVMP